MASADGGGNPAGWNDPEWTELIDHIRKWSRLNLSDEDFMSYMKRKEWQGLSTKVVVEALVESIEQTDNPRGVTCRCAHGIRASDAPPVILKESGSSDLVALAIRTHAPRTGRHPNPCPPDCDIPGEHLFSKDLPTADARG